MQIKGRNVTLELESLQVAIFTPGAASASAATLWPTLTTAPMLAFQAINPAHAIARGEINGMVVEVQTQPMRFDVFVRANDIDPAWSAQPILTDVDGAVDLGLEISTKLLSYPPIQRIGVIAEFRALTATAEAANTIIKSSLPGIHVPEPASDLLFQINLPRPSRARPEITMNRLTKWSQSTRILMMVPVQPGLPAVPPSPPQYSADLRIDINNVPQTLLPSDAATDLIKEGLDYMRDVARQGQLSL